MDDISVVQFRNPSQTSLEDLLPGLHRNLLPNEAQEVVSQVFVYKYALFWNGVTWWPYEWIFAKPRPYGLIGVWGYVSRNIFQDKFVMSGSEMPLVRVLKCE